MKNNRNVNNSLWTELARFFSQNNSEELVPLDGAYDIIIDHISNSGIKNEINLSSVIDTMELLKKHTKSQYSDDYYITDLCRLVNVTNTIAHAYEKTNPKLGREYMLAKDACLLQLAKTCLAKSKTGDLDIVFGLKVDDSKDVNGYLMVFDIAGTGQLSWHATPELAEVVGTLGVKPYPFPMENIKNTHVANTSLLNVAKSPEKKAILNKVLSNPHQDIVANFDSDVADEESLYDALMKNYFPMTYNNSQNKPDTTNVSKVIDVSNAINLQLKAILEKRRYRLQRRSET